MIFNGKDFKTVWDMLNLWRNHPISRDTKFFLRRAQWSMTILDFTLAIEAYWNNYHHFGGALQIVADRCRSTMIYHDIPVATSSDETSCWHARAGCSLYRWMKNISSIPGWPLPLMPWLTCHRRGLASLALMCRQMILGTPQKKSHWRPGNSEVPKFRWMVFFHGKSHEKYAWFWMVYISIAISGGDMEPVSCNHQFWALSRRWPSEKMW